eukprot:8122172-Pyramimonas_sp.AAC.1
MEKAFDVLLPMLPTIRRYFDLEKLLCNTADGNVDAQTIRDAKLLLYMPSSTEVCETLRICGNVLSSTSHRLEGVRVPRWCAACEGQPQEET